MAQLFHPSLNTVCKAVPFAAILVAVSVTWADWAWQRSSWQTSQGRFVDQEVPFSHLHHVRGLGIDCRFCHTGVETSSYAGLPPTKTCMTCHSQIWRDAQVLQPVRDSWAKREPIRWNRVHNLPGYVYFNHSAHVNNGVGCSSCHGNVALMPLMYQASSLQMDWCLKCHRNPEQFLRPRDQIFNTAYQPPADQLAVGRALVEQYRILSPRLMQSCSTCHR